MATEGKDSLESAKDSPPTFGARMETDDKVSEDIPFTFGGVPLDNDTKKQPRSFSSAFGSDKEALSQRLQLEKECLEKAKEQLRRAQQHVDQVTKKVQQTQAELDRSEEEVNKSRILFECRGVCDNILSFLDVPDLGRVAGVCPKWNFLAQEERLWQTIVLRKWPAVPAVVTNYREYYKSLLLRSMPERQLNYPHWEDNDDDEEYYLIVEFPGLRESTPDGQKKPIIRSVKLDKSLMSDEHQMEFENPICSCGKLRCNNQIRENGFVRLPINVQTASFYLEELHQLIQFKISILRSSDCKVALLFDPSSNGFSAQVDDDEHPEDILFYCGNQTPREIPSFKGSRLPTRSQLSFYIRGGVQSHNDYVPISFPFGGSTTFFKRFEDGNYGAHIKHVVVAFLMHEEKKDDDCKHHLAPPFQSKCVTEFLSMAGVQWR